jgi:hypothetical protein
MKLAIAVVYMVSERNEKLLDLHFDLIEKYTEVPYTIYAGTNRLLPRFQETLRSHPRVKVCSCKTYEPGSGLTSRDAFTIQKKGAAVAESKYEHSFYLEQLIREAIDDGSTHVALFHVDSFPVRLGWVGELTGRLSETCVLAAITRDPKLDHKPLTAFTLFERGFYLKYQPRLLPSPQEFASDAYRKYKEVNPHMGDSGCGYGFKMFTEGLSWHPLIRSNKGGHHTMFASIYGDTVFHLHAAAYVDSTKYVGFTSQASQAKGVGGWGRRVVRAVLPEGTRDRIKASLPDRFRDPREYQNRQAWERERQRLFANPEAYLAYLRTGVERDCPRDRAGTNVAG